MSVPTRPTSPLLAAEVVDADTQTSCLVAYNTPEWVALCEWMEFHGIDSRSVMGSGARITRDGQARQIRYVGIVSNEAGRPALQPDPDPATGTALVTQAMVEQGEAIAPLPEVVARRLW